MSSSGDPVTIRRLRLQNYKAFSKFDLKFTGDAFLVGPNNAGKSTLIEAIKGASVMLKWASQRRPDFTRQDGGQLVWAYKTTTQRSEIEPENLRHNFRSAEARLIFELSNDTVLTAVWPPVVDDLGNPTGDADVDVRCRNDSDALIYDVRPFVIAYGQTHRGPRNEVDGRVVRKVPRGGTRILPSQEVTLRLQLAGADAAVRADIDASLNENGYGITFVDNAGNWWRKWGNLALEDDPSACEVSDVGELSTQRSHFVASQLPPFGG